MGRVVFGKNTEPGKWFRLDSLLQDIAADQPSDPSIVPGVPAIDPQNSVSDRSGVVALSSQPDIFQSATAASASSQGAVWPHVTKLHSSISAFLISRLATRLTTLKSFPCPLRVLAESAPFIRIQI